MRIPSYLKSTRAIAFFAFAAVYLGWGSTYLAIVLALETLPPFFIGATRFTAVGGILYLYARLAGAKAPSSRQWADAFLVGGLLFFVGNGTVVWAEQYVPSGVVALLVATVPLFMAALNAWQMGSPPRITVIGILLGLVGVAVLVNPWAEVGSVPWRPGLLLLFSCFSWSVGSLYARRLKTESKLLTAAMQMFAGGVLLMMVSAFRGEPWSIAWASVSARSVMGVVYLGVVGSFVAFSAYIWLLANVSAEKASTYAYVNPAVAVILGYFFAAEPLTSNMLVAGAIILVSVAMILLPRRAPKLRAVESPAELTPRGFPKTVEASLKSSLK